MLQDINFPQTQSVPVASYTAADQRFRFGDLVTLSGQTAAGISIAGQTAICISQAATSIKKHSFPFSVDPNCSSLFFDFERLVLSGIPVGSGLTTSVAATCLRGVSCSFSDYFTFFNVPLFSAISGSFSFGSVAGPFAFSGATATLAFGGQTLALIFNSNLTLSSINGVFDFTLNPESNPASLQVTALFIPGVGLTNASTNLSVTRSGLTASALFNFTATVTGGVTLSSLTLTASAQAGVVSADASATFTPTQMIGANVGATVSF